MVLSAALLLATAWAQAASPPPVLAIEHVAVIDVARGRSIGPRTVVVRDGRIAEIGMPEAVTVPADAQRLDGRGRYLIPGLVDMHVHLFNNSSNRPPNTWAFPMFVAHGVTGVREMRATIEQIAQVRAWNDAVARGELVAPRVLAAGVAIVNDTDDAVRAQVRAIHDAGGDFAKVFSGLPSAAWQAAMDEARRIGLPLDGHIPDTATPVAAARAGQRTGEHLTQVYEACTSRESALIAERAKVEGEARFNVRVSQDAAILRDFDADTCRRVARALARTRHAQVPTLMLPYAETRWPVRDFRDDPRWSSLRADEQERWASLLASPDLVDTGSAARRWTLSRDIAAILHDAGVTLLAGSDAPMPLLYPGASLQEELARFVDAGLTPAEALRAATLAPAQVLGIARDYGTVAVGKHADLVLLDADPLVDIDHVRSVRATVIAGRVHPGIAASDAPAGDR